MAKKKRKIKGKAYYTPSINSMRQFLLNQTECEKRQPNNFPGKKAK